MRCYMLAALLCLSFVTFAQNRTFYVSASGNDNTDGSLSKPWRTVEPVNNFDFQPGDVLYFAGGQTFEDVLLEQEDGGLTIASYNGTATLGGLYAYNVGDITIDGVNFVGSGLVNMQDGINFYMDSLTTGDLDNIIIKNVSVSNFGGNGFEVGTGTGAYGYNNVKLLDCKLFGNFVNGFFSYGYKDLYSHTQLYINNTKAYRNYGRTDVTLTRTGSGIMVSGFENGIVENSEAYENGRDNRYPGGGPQGFWCYNARNVVFQNCVSHDNRAGKTLDGGGFDIDGGSQNCIIQYCYSYNNDGAGLAFFEHGSTNQFDNNIIRYSISQNDGRRNAHAGFMSWARDSLNRVKNSYVYNNTFYVTPSATATAGYPAGSYLKGSNYKNVSFFNNIIYTTSTLRIWVGATTGVIFSNNGYYTPGQAASFTKGGTWKDPMFTNAGGGKGGYVLRAPSPMIDAGKAHTATQDIIGTSVPLNSGYDIGAYESTSKPPVANAGADQTLTLPADATLSGTGTDGDGTIDSYIWTLISGPSAYLINTPAAATTTIGNLVEGTYTFRLTVTDNDGASRSDDVKLIVTTEPPAGAKLIKVNLYGGTNPYTGPGWNNWNVTSSLKMSALKYSDALTSTVSATLSAATALSDNGSAYGGIMAPPEVLRYASYHNATRTLTLSGLSTTKTYNLELYGSRGNTGNSTVFTIGSTTVTVVTDQNKSNKASFTNLRTNASGQLVVTMEKTATYSYLNGFILTVNSGTVDPPVAPKANAGPDQTSTLPNTVTFNGTGTDADGTITKYTWTKVSGPAQYTIETPGSATTTVSNLIEGTYKFRLTVRDNDGSTGYDEVVVFVNPVPPANARLVKVNVYGGVNAYGNKAWNNWNVSASRTISALKYADESTSSVGVSFNASGTITDNGSTYGGIMAPPEVLRYASYSNTARTLTISGLSTTKTYSLELYASRGNTNNGTIFTIGGTSITIVTDQNKTNKAIFTGLVPDGLGKLVVSISQTGTYHYLNGFTLIENNNTATTALQQDEAIAAIEESGADALQAHAFPNPSADRFILQLKGRTGTPMRLRIADGLGRVVEARQGLMAGTSVPVGGAYKAGVYYAEVVQGNRRTVLKLVKTTR